MKLPSAALVVLSIACSGCDRMTTSKSVQSVRDAQAKTADGDFIHAISLYESALNGSASAADVHYQLALLYDDKMNDPLNALHHFKRYLTLAPNGSHTSEAKDFMKRDELALLTSLSGDTVMTRAEATRLKNENLNLRKQIEETWVKAHAAGANERVTRATAKATPAKKKPARRPR